MCINQSDDKEKSWQVGLMADIYRHAYKVIAWLGPADESSDSVVDCLNAFGEKAEACCMDVGPEPYLEVWKELALNTPTRTLASRMPWSSQIALHSLFRSVGGWHDQDHLLPIASIRSFFTRPWWGRIWILQEITLPENAELICGTKKITRSRCSAIINAYLALWFIVTVKFKIEPKSLTPYHFEIIQSSFHHRPNIMLSSRRIYKYGGFPLAALLRATCVGSINLHRHGPHNLESTDPRDKIFALLGLAADREELEDLGVFPDYTKSYEQTYATAMAAMLQQGHLSLLSLCQTHGSPRHLPSWIPDWSKSITDMLQDVENDHVTVYPRFNASGAKQQNVKVSIIRNEGSIKGISVMCFLYDEIHEIGYFPDRASSHEVPLSETFTWPIKWLLEIIRMTYYNEQVYGNFSNRLHAAARSSIGGVGWNEDAEMARVGDDRFFDAVILLQKGINRIKNNRIKFEAQQFLASKAVKDIAKNSAVVQPKLDSEIFGKSLGRLPFITKRGHLGLGYEYIQRGDVVALIRGVQVPFVLRNHSGGQYEVVGEAYVDGIMDGEAMEGSKCDHVELV